MLPCVTEFVLVPCVKVTYFVVLDTAIKPFQEKTTWVDPVDMKNEFTQREPFNAKNVIEFFSQETIWRNVVKNALAALNAKLYSPRYWSLQDMSALLREKKK